MRSPLSPSSYCSLTATNLNKRLLTIFKKAHELTTLCDIEACVIHYGADGGEVKTWPEERDKVRDLALRYIQLDQAKRVKKSVNLYGFLNKKKKKAKRNVEEPNSDHHYSPHQINQLIHSLELSYSVLQERRRFESRKQDLEIESLNPEDYSALPQVPGLKSQELCVYDDHYDLVDFQDP